MRRTARALALGGGVLLLLGDAMGLTPNMFAAILVAASAGAILFVGGACLG